MSTTRTTAPKSNRYRAQCGTCRVWTAPGGGTIKKVGRSWVLTCSGCSGEAREAEAESYGYRGGMCEDAPCCGCCGPGSDDPAWSPYGDEGRHDGWYGDDY